MTRQARDLIATGESERAADLLECAIAIDDGAGFGYLYLGYVHLTAGHLDQADVFLDRAAALLPPDPALRVPRSTSCARAPTPFHRCGVRPAHTRLKPGREDSRHRDLAPTTLVPRSSTVAKSSPTPRLPKTTCTRCTAGVVPELAARRRYLQTVQRVIARAMRDAGARYDELDAIAATRGPGLMGSLLVGVSVAKGSRSHRPAVRRREPSGRSRAVAADFGTTSRARSFQLLVSGGHTALYLVREVGSYHGSHDTGRRGRRSFRQGRQDARAWLSRRPRDRRDRAGRRSECVRVSARAACAPTPWRGAFRRLKTALWDFLRDASKHARVADVCASFPGSDRRRAVDRAVRAMDATGIERLVVSGGVSANSRLRARMRKSWPRRGATLAASRRSSCCTDNAAMIAGAAAMRLEPGPRCERAWLRFRACRSARRRIDSVRRRPRWGQHFLIDAAVAARNRRLGRGGPDARS